MKKKRILLASVLKPLNDTRMFEKLGKSLSKTGKAEIHICGFDSITTSSDPKIFFYPLFHNSRLSIQRLLVSVRYFKLLWQIKPEVIIVCQPELIPASLLFKIFRKVYLIYDIQENYKLNIQTQSVYPKKISSLLGNIIRLVEKWSSYQIHTYFLAEKSYVAQLPFVKNRYLVIENKYKNVLEHPETAASFIRGKKEGSLNFVYTGTISELYGIFEAIQLIDKLHALNNQVTLTIIGYCPQKHILNWLKEVTLNKPYIKLIGGYHLVPHEHIIQEIKKADVGLLPYHLHPSLSSCMPTKLYEYIAHQLPLVITENSNWQPLVKASQAGILIDFNHYDPVNLLNKIQTGKFYGGVNKPDVFWETEELKLLLWGDSTIFKETR